MSPNTLAKEGNLSVDIVSASENIYGKGHNTYAVVDPFLQVRSF
jgi:hypothetical protein